MPGVMVRHRRRKGVKRIKGYDDVVRHIEEIMRVMRWFLSQDKRFMQMALLVSTPRDLVQDAAIYLLAHPPEKEFSLTTVAAYGIRWTVLRQHKRYRKTMESRQRESIELTAVPAADPAYLSDEDRQDVQMLVVRALQTESSQHASILWERYALGWSLRKIGEKRKRTPERMRQIADRLLGKLQVAATLPQLAEYVDLLKREYTDEY